MCTTRGELISKKKHFKVRLVFTDLTVPRLKKAIASLWICCSCGSHTFRLRFVLAFSSNGRHSGAIFFKPEKNLEFFRLKNCPRDDYPGKLE